MSQSLSQIYLHVVFSTKNRVPHLQDNATREALHKYLAGVCRNLESSALIVGGVADHVHILCRLSKNTSVADYIRELKRESSRWMKNQRHQSASFYWQSGYGAFSISPGHVEALTKYIATQEEHHRRETFQQEFRRLLRKYQIDFDERFVWD